VVNIHLFEFLKLTTEITEDTEAAIEQYTIIEKLMEYHEEHEGHEVVEKPFFVLFVSFVVLNHLAKFNHCEFFINSLLGS
jgi:hypothetical protein